jgi:hypothetical protein
MKNKVKYKLEKLNENFHHLTGQRFQHFFCPLLHKDEDVPLCEAHLINRAFENTARAWTVQRKDVDGFFGSKFESSFLNISYKIKGFSPEDVIIDQRLSKRFRPKFLVDNKPVQQFSVKGSLPKDCTFLRIQYGQKTRELGLKIKPDSLSRLVDSSVGLVVQSDFRVQAVVSLLKSAYLTLFEILGYDYALSSGGQYIGRQILGEFFLKNYLITSTDKVLNNARSFFQRYAFLVQSIETINIDFRGTISDRKLLICFKNNVFWAFIIFIRIDNSFHSVLIPILDSKESELIFENFLNNYDEDLEVIYTRFSNKEWHISNQSFHLKWPKKGISLLN